MKRSTRLLSKALNKLIAPPVPTKEELWAARYAHKNTEPLLTNWKLLVHIYVALMEAKRGNSKAGLA